MDSLCGSGSSSGAASRMASLSRKSRSVLDRRAWSFVDVDLLGLLDTVGIELEVGTAEHDAAAEHFHLLATGND
jgi:hypothetical protein